MEGLGQLHYQCSRCLIIYSTLDQMEKHIGQFHMSIRSVDDAPFELNDDNIHTLVKLVWDANLNYNFYTGFVRKFSFSEPNLYGGSSSPPPMTQPQQQPMHFDYGKTTPIPVCINGTQTHLPVLTSSLTGGSQLATDLRGFLEPMRPSINSSVSSNLMNSTILPGKFHQPTAKLNSVSLCSNFWEKNLENWGGIWTIFSLVEQQFLRVIFMI